MATSRAEFKAWDGSSLKAPDEIRAGSTKTQGGVYVWNGSALKLAYPSTGDISQVASVTVNNSTANSDSAMVIAWALNSTAEVYDRYRIDEKEGVGAFAEVAQLARGVATFTSTGLTEQTKYTYRVRAVYDAIGYSTEDVSGPYSVLHSSTTTKTAPSTAFTWAPGYPQDDPTDGVSVLLRAVGVASSTQYDVYWKLNASMAGDPVANGTLRNVAPETAMEAPSDYDLASTGAAWAHNDVIYLYARGRNSGGPGPFSTAEASVTIVEAVPGVPTIGTASVSTAVWTADVVFTPNAPLTATSFNARYQNRNCPSTAWSGWSNFDTEAASPITAGVLEGYQYRFSVRAQGAGGNSTYSSISNVVSASATPTAPTSLVCSISTVADPTDEFFAKWVLGGGTVDEHEIEHKTTAESWTGTPDVTGIGAASTSYTVTGVSDDTRYDVRVRAANDCGQDGAWSATAQVVTDPVAPAVPLNYSAAYPLGVAYDSLRLRVQSAVGADGYDFYYASSSGVSTGSSVAVTNDGDGDYTLSGLSANTRYWTRARSYHDGINFDTWSALNTETNGVTLVDVPLNLFAEFDTSTCPAVINYLYKWTNENSTGTTRSETMTVQRQSSTGWATASAAVGAGSTSYADNNIGSTDVTGFRVKYNTGSGNWASRTGGPDFPPECPA